MNAFSFSWRVGLVSIVTLGGVVFARAADPAIVLQDPAIPYIETVELFRSGLYWWSGGRCGGDFGYAGGASYRTFSNMRLTVGGPLDVSIKALNRGGFQPGGQLEAGLFTGTYPTTESSILPAGCDYGAYFVRDDEAFYYAASGSLYRKPLSWDRFAPGITIDTVLGLNRFPVPADGALAVDGPTLWFYTRNENGSLSINNCGKTGTVLVTHRFSVTSGGVEKFGLFDIKDANGHVLRTSAILLTFEGELYEFDTSKPNPPQLLHRGVSDFAVRDEGLRIGVRLQHATILYVAVGHPVTNSGNGALLSFDLTAGGIVEQFNTGTHDLQITSVAVDSSRIFITRTPFGPNMQSQSELLRENAPAYDGAIISPEWASITRMRREYRSLRSDGSWLYFAHANTIQSIETGAPRVDLDFQAMGIEVTQGIQNLNNTVPLVARKPILVRGYARLGKNTTGRAAFSVPAEVSVLRNGIDIEGSPFAADESAPVTTVDSWASVRTNRSQSFQFSIPPESLSPGTYEFRFTINPRLAVPETGVAPLINNTATAKVQLIGVGKPTLVFSVMSSTLPNYDPRAANSGFWPIIARAESMLPVPGFDVRLRSGSITKPVVTVLEGIKGRSFDLPDDQGVALAWLSLANARDHVLDLLSPPHYIGMFPQEVSNFNGKGGVGKQSLSTLSSGLYDLLSVIGIPDLELPENPFTRSLLVRMSQEVVPGAPWNNPMGGRTLAHELGHNFGRLHIQSTKACGSQDPDGPFHTLPDGASPCTLGKTDLNDPATSVGFDPITWNVVLPSMNGDLMSYASNRWTSEFTWRALLNAVPSGPPPEMARSVGSSSSKTPRPQDNNPSWLLVQGTLFWQTNGAEIRSANVVSADALDPETLNQLAQQFAGYPQQFPFRLSVLDAALQPLTDQALALQPTSDNSAALPFLQAMPFDPRTRVLRVVNGPTVIAEMSVSEHDPEVHFTDATLSDDGSRLDLSWIASDADGDTLSFMVQVSNDGGLSWTTVALNLPDTHVTIDTTFISGGSTLQARVIGSDGFRSAKDLTTGLALPQHVPSVQLTGVEDGDQIAFGTPLTLLAHGYDAEDGSLDRAQIRWSLSGIESLNHTGAVWSLPNLAPGDHTLTLSAVDSQNQLGTQQTRFYVRPLLVPEGEEPVLDGLCADPAYAPSGRMRLAQGTGGTLFLAHSGSSLFACFQGMHYGAQGSSGASVGIYLDTTLSKQLSSNTVGFVVDEHGQSYRYQGDGSQMLRQIDPPLGFSVVILRDQSTWSAEMRISDSLVGGWNHRAGLATSVDDGNLTSPITLWPSDARLDDASTWSVIEAGVPPRVTLLQPPRDSTVEACGEVQISVNASGPSPLRYQWRLDGLALQNDEFISGSSSPSLRIDHAQQKFAGLYDVVVTDPFDSSNSVTSRVARLTVSPGPQWILRATNGPIARSGHGLAYDTARQITWLYGGWRTNALGAQVTLGDIWGWDGSEWKQYYPDSPQAGWEFSQERQDWTPSYLEQPVGRTQAGVVYDNHQQRLLIFGGQTRSPGGDQLFLSDLWAWDGLSWELLARNGPAARSNPAMTYDVKRGVVVMTGGFINGPDPTPGAVWEWSSAGWKVVSPSAGPSTSYSQDAGRMVYDPVHQTSFFGPSVGAESGFAFWDWNGIQWESVPAKLSPGFFRLEYGAMAYHIPRRRPVWFGGQNGVASNITGEFDGATWSVLDTGPKVPSPRSRSAMAYDTNRNAIVLFGGELSDRNYLGDTWELIALDAPLVIIQPEDHAFEPGQAIEFTVEAIGLRNERLAYQWFRGDVPLAESSNHQGTETSRLILPSISPADIGTYRALVSNGCGASWSRAARLGLAPLLQVRRSGNEVILSWSVQTSTLQKAPAVTGPWTTVPNAKSPLQVPLLDRYAFFRVSTP